MPDRETLERWFEEGESIGASQVIAMYDTFESPPGEYPEFIMPDGKRHKMHENDTSVMTATGRMFYLSQGVDHYYPKEIPGVCSRCWGPCGCG